MSQPTVNILPQNNYFSFLFQKIFLSIALTNTEQYRACYQPPTPSPSLHPLLQLGESCEIVDSQHQDSDKVRRIRELEDNVRIQEEVVINLKEKLSNGPENGAEW